MENIYICVCIFIEMLFKNETTENHPARNPCELQCCERYYTSVIHIASSQEAVASPSDRWFCSKAFPGSTHELCHPHPEKQRKGMASADHQKLQPPPQVLSSSLLQENHFKSMNSRKEGYKHSPLYSAHSNPINHRCSSDSAKTSLIDFQWPGG